MSLLRRHILHFGATTLADLPLSRRARTAHPQARRRDAARRGGRAFRRRPYGDAHYAASRPQLALKAPGTADGRPAQARQPLRPAPALAPLHRHFEGGQLALCTPAARLTQPRSHFDAQGLLSPARRAASPRPMAG